MTSKLLQRIGGPLYSNKRLIGYYWQRTKKNKLAVAGLAFILFLILLAVIGPFFTVDPTKSNFEENNLPPVGFSTEVSIYNIATGQFTTSKTYGTWKHPLGTE